MNKSESQKLVNVTIAVVIVIMLGSSQIFAQRKSRSRTSSTSQRTTPQTQEDDPAKRDLLGQFLANYKTEHEIAYKAAKEYLKKYPNDNGENAEFMRSWAAAYEKVRDSNQASNPQSNTSASPSKPPDSSSKESAKLPSLEETLNWLKDKIGSEGSTSYRKGIMRFNYRIEPVRFDGCTLSLKEKYHSVAEHPQGQSTTDMEDDITISLAKIDATRLEVINGGEFGIKKDGWHLRILISKNNGIFYAQRTNYRFANGQTDSRSNELYVGGIDIYLGSEDVAKRAAKAFTRAIELCQGSESKEPF